MPTPVTSFEHQMFGHRSTCPICGKKGAVRDKIGWFVYCEFDDEHTPEQMEAWKQTDEYKHTYGRYDV